LKNYKLKNGRPLFDLDGQIKWDSDYKVPENLDKSFDSFLAKYDKLAKNVQGKDRLRKVPGKSIYIVDGSAQVDLVSMLGTNWVSTPFTLIAKDNADIVIKWTLITNAMIMTKSWYIWFEGGCNGDSTMYGHAWQMVRGIFYAWGGFRSTPIKNNDFYHSEWCNYYNIHIKWVVIWPIENLKNSRRSELYAWFSEPQDWKKNLVINGASVLIEYNPDLDGQLPPGAEEFNKALDVYRS
jgi:hypothetical protein